MDAKTANTFLINEAVKNLEECKAKDGINSTQYSKWISNILWEALSLNSSIAKISIL